MILYGEMSAKTMSGSIFRNRSINGGVSEKATDISIITDKTLTIEGRAADAKVTGDRLSQIEAKVDYLEEEVGDASLLLSLI